MELSKFIIKSPLGSDKILLYNTLNTALVVLEEKQHREIFVKKHFSNNNIVQQLFQMKFLVNDNNEEMLLLEEIRKKDLDNRIPVVSIFPTNKCNAKCDYCFEKGINHVDMTKETATQTVSFIKKVYPKKELQIMWFGGEPLLNFEIIKQITLELKKSDYKLTTHVTTNGSLLTQNMIDFFKKYYSRISFQITIDDINEKYYNVKQYEDLTPDSAFDTVVNNCKMLINSEVFLKIRVNFNEDKIENAKNVYTHLKKIFSNYDDSLVSLYLAPLNLNCESYTIENGVVLETLSKDKEHPLLTLTKFHREQGYSKYDQNDKAKQLLSYYWMLPKGSACGAFSEKWIKIDAQGKLFKCHRLVQYDKYVVGSVFDGIDYDNPHYKFFLDPVIRDKKCRVCNRLPICHGGCAAMKLLYGYTFECRTKEIQADLLQLYYDELVRSVKQ